MSDKVMSAKEWMQVSEHAMWDEDAVDAYAAYRLKVQFDGHIEMCNGKHERSADSGLLGDERLADIRTANNLGPLDYSKEQAELLGHIDALTESNRELAKALNAASHALRSYQYRNSSTDLAEECADAIDAVLAAHKPEGV